MFLHAWRLQFNHPVTAERIALQADLPPDLKAYLDHAQLKTPPV
jgi:23S rRNA pseudouridine955/2504/2580 synthase